VTGRRFPLPRTVIEHAESFRVQEAGGQTVGWFYFRHNEGTTRNPALDAAAYRITRDHLLLVRLSALAGSAAEFDC